MAGRYKALVRGVMLLMLALTFIIWTILLIEIKLIDLPVNCSGAWPSNTPLLFLIDVGTYAVMYTSLYVYFSKEMHLFSKLLPVLIMSSITIMSILFLRIWVLVLCICYDYEIIYRTYLWASAMFLLDVLVKSSLLLVVEYDKKKNGE